MGRGLNPGQPPTDAQLAYLRAVAPTGEKHDVMAKRLGVGAQRVRSWCDQYKIPRCYFVAGIGPRIGVVQPGHTSGRKRTPLLKSLGRSKAKARAYSWLLTSATTPARLEQHRTALEEDCFPSERHREVLRDAAGEYDAWDASVKVGGRPRKPKPIFIPSRRQRVA